MLTLRSSRICGAATALGLHCYQPPSTISLHSEMSKRLLCCIFWSDKEISTFNGRPPSLSHRYVSCPLPLDVSDKALRDGGRALEDEIMSLDRNGWNTKGKVYDATIGRWIMTSAFVRDEILELFLGNQAQWSLEGVKYDPLA